MIEIIEAEPQSATIGEKTLARYEWESLEEFKARVSRELPARGGAIAVLQAGK